MVQTCVFKKKLAAAAVAIGVAFAVGATPVAANATPFWTPVRSYCNAGTIVQLTFYTSGPGVIVGYGNSSTAAGNTIRPWQLNTGYNVINTGVSTIWWQKWASGSAATITSWSLSCVNYQRFAE